jgi:hypothetical protein
MSDRAAGRFDAEARRGQDRSGGARQVPLVGAKAVETESYRQRYFPLFDSPSGVLVRQENVVAFAGNERGECV